MRLLIVEDDKGLKEILGILCTEHWGINKCFFAGTVKEAIEEIKKGKPDLIFLDFLLGNEISTSLIDFVREEYPNDPPRIVVMSALTDGEQMAKEHNIKDFVKKPFELESLEIFL